MRENDVVPAVNACAVSGVAGGPRNAKIGPLGKGRAEPGPALHARKSLRRRDLFEHLLATNTREIIFL